MKQGTHAPDHAAQTDAVHPIQRAIQGVGLALLGAAAALPVICLYLTKRALRKDKQTLDRRPTQPEAEGSQPIHIPISSLEEPTSEEAEKGSTAEDQVVAAPLYVASTESDKFHDPACRWARQIRPEHRIEFSNREEALAQDLSPCQTCRP